MSEIAGHLKTADDVLGALDLSDRRALITGASGGLGRELARALAARGAEVLAQFESGYSAGRRSALGVPAAPDAADSDAPLYTIARQMGVRAVEAMVAEDREQKLKRQRRTRFTAAMICAVAVVLVVLLLTF